MNALDDDKGAGVMNWTRRDRAALCPKLTGRAALQVRCRGIFMAANYVGQFLRFISTPGLYRFDGGH